MHNQQQPSSGNQAESNRQLAQRLETVLFPPRPAEEKHQLENLLETGFNWEEANNLVYLRDYLYENPEMRQRVADDNRMHFVRWLYEQGEIGEN